MRQFIWGVWHRVEFGFCEAFHLIVHWLLTLLNVLSSISPLLLLPKIAVFQVFPPWLLTFLITWLKTLVNISQSKHYPSSLKFSHGLCCFCLYLKGIRKFQLWDYSEFWKQLLQNPIPPNWTLIWLCRLQKIKNINFKTVHVHSTVEN